MEEKRERETSDVVFCGVFLVFGRAIICYKEPEVQDFTKTATVDRIWLNLNETFKGNKSVKQSP